MLSNHCGRVQRRRESLYLPPEDLQDVESLRFGASKGTTTSLLFDITCLSAGDSAVVVVCGELDIARAPRLAAAINDVLRTKPAAVVIDLNQVDFVDSTALSVLLNARRRTLRQGIDLRLACEVRSTLRLLALTRLENDFDVYPTREAALIPVGESAA